MCTVLYTVLCWHYRLKYCTVYTCMLLLIFVIFKQGWLLKTQRKGVILSQLQCHSNQAGGKDGGGQGLRHYGKWETTLELQTFWFHEHPSCGMYVKCVEHNTVYSTVHIYEICRTCRTMLQILYKFLICFRIVREITYREFQRVKARSHLAAPDLTDEQLQEGRKNVCPLRWQKKALDALHEGTRSLHDRGFGGCKPVGHPC